MLFSQFGLLAFCPCIVVSICLPLSALDSKHYLPHPNRDEDIHIPLAILLLFPRTCLNNLAKRTLWSVEVSRLKKLSIGMPHCLCCPVSFLPPFDDLLSYAARPSYLPVCGPPPPPSLSPLPSPPSLSACGRVCRTVTRLRPPPPAPSAPSRSPSTERHVRPGAGPLGVS